MSKYFDSIHVRFNQLCSFLPMKCVQRCVDELHKISCNSYYILITQQRLERASISSWSGSSTGFKLKILVKIMIKSSLVLIPAVVNCGSPGDVPNGS